jgi:hypothetical protein
MTCGTASSQAQRLPGPEKGQATHRHSLHLQPIEEDRGCGGGHQFRNSPRILARATVAPASMRRRRIRRAASRRRRSLLPRLGKGLTMSRRNCYEADWPICRPFYRGIRISSGRSMSKGSSILRKSSVARKSNMPKIILQDVSSVCPPGHWHVGEVRAKEGEPGVEKAQPAAVQPLQCLLSHQNLSKELRSEMDLFLFFYMCQRYIGFWLRQQNFLIIHIRTLVDMGG